MGSRRSSSSTALRVVSALGLACAAGCVTVRPEDKEHLADPAMIHGSGGVAARHEAHVLENREGARGGTATAGGCGCN